MLFRSRVVHETPSTALLDGDGGLGPVVGHRAMTVAIGGAVRTFTLDAAGKGTLPDGSRVVLKAKWPKGGAGVPAGTIAKVQAAIKSR